MEKHQNYLFSISPKIPKCFCSIYPKIRKSLVILHRISIGKLLEKCRNCSLLVGNCSLLFCEIHVFWNCDGMRKRKLVHLVFLIDFDKLRYTHLYESSANCVSTNLLMNKILHLYFDFFLVGIIACFSDRFPQ